MSPRRVLNLVAIMIAIFVVITSDQSDRQLAAQEDDTCTTFLNDALQVVGTACSEMGRNEACYGHFPITVELQEDVDTQFENDGDLIDIIDLESLVTNPANPETGDWGIALMLVQADLPEDTESTMTFVLFGDVEVSSAVEDVPALTTCNVANEGTGNINIRSGAGTDRDITGTFSAGSDAIANGRNEAGDWIRIEQNGTLGWVFSDLVSLDCGIETLAVVSETESALPISAPMQAITLRSAQNDTCESAPDGLLIRSPEGRRARVMVNGVEMVFSSAGFLSAQANADMTVQGLEGEIAVTSDGVTETVLPDTYTTVAMDSNLQPAGPPDIPQPVPPSEIASTLNMSLDVLYENEIGIERCLLTANQDSNIRTGPGTDYSLGNTLDEGQQRLVNAQATGTDNMLWWRIGIRWVRSDLVTTTGDCSRIPEITDIDPPPTPAPSTGTGGGGSGNFLIFMNGSQMLAICEPSTISVGTSVVFHYGTGFQTEEEAAAAYATASSTISVNGENLAVTRFRHSFCPPSDCPPVGAYGFVTEARWQPTEPGTYSIVGNDGRYTPYTCVITVQ